MKSSDLFLTFLIILLFIGIYIFNTLVVNIENIKKDWPLYRCNPLVMPFAGRFGHDPQKNFVHCVQNAQVNFMQYILEPVHFTISIINNSMSGILDSIQWVRVKIASFVQNIKDIIDNIFSVFINIIIQFQKVMMKLKDTFGKVLGIMTTVIYLMTGGILSGTSIMAGPIGDTLCFHPNTMITLKDGTRKAMRHIQPGDVLVNNSKVLASLNILGNADKSVNAQYYSIYDESSKETVYVTGDHKVFDRKTNTFIPVKSCSFAKLEEQMTTERMSCLVTDDHLIPFGDIVFWDWED